MGVPRLASLQPAAWLKGGPSVAHLHQHKPKTLARAKPRGAGDVELPQARPRQAGSRGGGEIKARGTSRGAHEASHDDQDQPGARRAPACAVSSFPLWCKEGKHRRGVLRHHAKVSISVQRDQDQQDGRTEVTVEPKTASPPEPLVGEEHL